MQTEFAKALFYSLLFAIGGAPTIAMWIIRLQISDPNLWWPPFVGLTLILACILAPVILLQNTFLYLKKKEWKDASYEGFAKTYFFIDLICLASWLYFSLV